MPRQKKNHARLPSFCPTPILPPHPPLPIFEMRGDQLKVFTLHTLLTNKKRKETSRRRPPGGCPSSLVRKNRCQARRQARRHRRTLAKPRPRTAWSAARVCWASTVARLLVALDSTTVRAELDAQLRGGLLQKLQTESRGALFRVKTTVEAIPDVLKSQPNQLSTYHSVQCFASRRATLF